MSASRRWRLVFLLAVCACTVQGQTSAPQTFSVTDALSLYEGGAYPEFFDAIGRGVDFHRLFPTFETAANRWVKTADTVSRWRRTLVAAAVALEVAHLLRDEPADQGARYLVWASLLMRVDPPATPSAAERLWYLASVAGMEEQAQPWVLTAGQATGSSVLQPIARKLGPGGHLAAASRRFPDEARFQLARVTLLESPLARHRFVPSYLELARRRAADRLSDEPRSTDELTATAVRDEALELLRQFARLPEVKRAYEALSHIGSLRAEVELHLGFLETAAMNWGRAQDHLRRVPALTDDDYLRYLSLYFSGRAFQNSGDHEAAVHAFEQAIRIVPNARSAATQLAAELLLTGRAVDRSRAYAMLQETFSDHQPGDPFYFYFVGDARLWPTYMSQLRQALR